MKHWPKKLRGPGKIHGGKQYLCRRFIELFPEDQFGWFLDVFGGMGSLTLNLGPGKLQQWNDINLGRFSLFFALKYHLSDFMELVEITPYTEVSFYHWRTIPIDSDLFKEDPVTCGFRTFVVSRMSRGGLGEHFAWSERLRGGEPGDLHAWHTILEELPRISDRLANVDLRNMDFEILLQQFQSFERCLAYLDPPYLHEVRTAKYAYGEDEMTPEQHETMLKWATSERQGLIAISHYHAKMYDDYLSKWRCMEFEIANHSGQGKEKNRRIECLWINWE